ncbi:Transposase and inactivated derivatives [Mycobacteroides abscessus subsp. abscessus]|nr:Transposase and inactivated derivatives [Mycobacteroides abscessus subsp. abscessus]
MARNPRKKSVNGIYHIIIRGINRQIIFEDKDDKIQYLKTLKRYKAISKYKLYGYCLMDNHIHLLCKEIDESISDVVKRISSSYVHWYNAKYERSGHLFEGRFKSETVEEVRYFLTVLRYIHQNPLKAGMAKSVLNCKWTSIREYVDNSNLVDTELALQLFSYNEKKALELFKAYTCNLNEENCLDVKNSVKITDQEVLVIMRSLGIPNSSAL